MKKQTTIMAVAAALAFAVVPALLAAHDNHKHAKAYPLKTCVVSDEELGKDAAMKPDTFVYKGQEVKLCCSGCKKDFDKDPAKYMKKIAAAQKK